MDRGAGISTSICTGEDQTGEDMEGTKEVERQQVEQLKAQVAALREELEDAQRANTKLRGWQDCARELLQGRT
jgi:hypothetical protein